MEEIIKYRITYTGENGTIYSVVEEYEEEYMLTLGTWEKPFLNTEEESTAFGLLESLGQSDYCPYIFLNGEDEVVKVEVVLVSKPAVCI